MPVSRKTKNKKHSTVRRRRSVWIGGSVKIIGAFLAVVGVFYISAGMALDHGFLKRDLSEKYGQVAGATSTVLSVRFLAPPEAPTLTATPLCQDYTTYIHLNWNSDSQVDYYDLLRDGLPLISGITADAYDDFAVEKSTDYSYAVTAFNAIGQATSVPVSATALDCGTPPLPEPTCVITRFDKTNLIDHSAVVSSTNRQPLILGTSNLPNATVEILLSGPTPLIGLTATNDNGYWSWSPPEKLDYGTYTIFVTVVDPADQSRKVTASLLFKIREPETDHHEEGETVSSSPSSLTSAPPVQPASSVPQEKNSALSLSVYVHNPENIAYPGKELSFDVSITVSGNFSPQENVLKYWVIDEDRQVVFEGSDKVFISGDSKINEKLTLPGLIKPGRYRIVAGLTHQGALITGEDDFIVKEVPLVSLGGGTTSITFGQIMRNLAWVIFWGLLLLLIFLLLLLLEYWISQHAIIQVTEKLLRDNGLITKRKKI